MPSPSRSVSRTVLFVVFTLFFFATVNVCSAFPPPRMPKHAVLPVPTTRILASNNGKFGVVFRTIGTVAKTAKNAVRGIPRILPKRWTQSKAERQTQLQKVALKNDIQGNLTMFLEDAPSVVRIMGKVMVPVLSSLVATVSKQLESQNRTVSGVFQEKINEATRQFKDQIEEEKRKKQWVQDVLCEAKIHLMANSAAREALGEPIVRVDMSSVVSNTATIDGISKTFIPVFSFFVVGSKNQGFASLRATDEGITSISLAVANQVETITVVPLTKNKGIFLELSSDARGGVSNSRDPSDYIDIELIGPN